MALFVFRCRFDFECGDDSEEGPQDEECAGDVEVVADCEPGGGEPCGDGAGEEFDERSRADSRDRRDERRHADIAVRFGELFFREGFRQDCLECRAEERRLGRHEEHHAEQGSHSPLRAVAETEHAEDHHEQFPEFCENQHITLLYAVGEGSRRGGHQQKRQNVGDSHREHERRIAEVSGTGADHRENGEHFKRVVVEHSEKLREEQRKESFGVRSGSEIARHEVLSPLFCAGNADAVADAEHIRFHIVRLADSLDGDSVDFGNFDESRAGLDDVLFIIGNGGVVPFLRH